MQIQIFEYISGTISIKLLHLHTNNAKESDQLILAFNAAAILLPNFPNKLFRLLQESSAVMLEDVLFDVIFQCGGIFPCSWRFCCSTLAKEFFVFL